MKGLRAELIRKAFHLTTLAYLAVYQIIGYPRIVGPMLAWTLIVLAVEAARLRVPAINRVLTAAFGSLIRPEESRRYSGIWHTTIGALFLFVVFGEYPSIVAAAICFMAFGDAAAAVVGKAVGRVRIGGSRKTIEGSLACFVACYLAGWMTGFPASASAVAAAAATVVELLPTTSWFNDNFWMPVVAAITLYTCGLS